MNHRVVQKALLIFILILGVNSSFVDSALAQETTGTITGRVTDQNGAAVAGTQVVISDTQRGLQRTYETTEDGTYTATLLSAGVYTITVENPGFKRYVQSNITLSVNDRRPIDIVLEAGQVAETVTVTGEDASLIQESPTQQGLINGTQVRQLPLNNRNFLQLATLTAGVTSSNPSQIGLGGLSVVSFSINGGRTSAVNYLVDGSRNVDSGSNLTLLTVPSVDAIQEFTILTSNYAPEFGRNGGGVINVVTRQGTNNFNGTLYEFFRNDALNARDPFITQPLRGLNRANGEQRFKQPLRYNNFGYTVGGPVFFPRFGEGGPALYNGRDRTFFFFSQEFRRVRATSAPVGTVASNDQRNGIFTRPAANATTAPVLLRNPVTGAVFPVISGGTGAGQTAVQQIPRASFDPNAVALLNFILPPNEGTNQFRRATPVAANFRQEIVRFDHNFSDTTTFTARYIRDDFERDDPGGNPFLDPFVLTNQAGTLFPNVAAQRTNTPGDNFVASLKFGLSPTTINEVAFDYARNLIQSNFVGTGTRANTPGFTSPELFPSTLQGALPGITISGVSGLAFTSPQNIENPSYTVRDNLTIVRGNHTLKLGAFISREAKNENAGNALNGAFTFNGTRTAAASGISTIPAAQLSDLAFADFLVGAPNNYIEDQNEVVVQLRYNTFEFYGQDSWKVTPRLTFDYGARYSIFQNPIELSDYLTSFRPDLYDPARAVRLNPDGNTLAVDPQTGQVIGDRFNGLIFANRNSPYGRRVQSNQYDTIGPRVGFAYNLLGNGTTVLRGGFGVYYDRTLVGIVEQNAFVNPLINSRVTRDSSATAPLSLSDPNAGVPRTSLPVITLQSTGDPFDVPRTLQYSLGLQREIFKNSVLEVAYVGTSGQNLLRLTNINQPLPLAERTSATVLRNNARPFIGYGNINDRRTEADSNYNSAQVTFNKRLSRGLQFGVVYTFSKNITDASTDRSDQPQDPRRPELERALSQFDRTHVFTTNFFYELPFLRGRTDVIGTLFGGFQIAGIYSAQSGVPLTITQSGDPLDTGTTVRPNLIGNPEGDGSLTRFFNTAAFQAVTTTFGTAGRGIVRGPGINNLDISVYKTFRFTENTNLQFRTEFFNVLNHAQYNNPGTTLGTPATFGVITSARDPRIIQFGLKLNY